MVLSEVGTDLRTNWKQLDAGACFVLGSVVVFGATDDFLLGIVAVDHSIERWSTFCELMRLWPLR